VEAAHPPRGGAQLIAEPAALDRAAVLAVAAGGNLTLAAPLLESIARRRTAVLSALASGAAVYGVNTGMGAQSNVALTVDEQSRHQHNLFLARAVGGPPWLEMGEARAVIAVRLRMLLSGDAGVSAELCVRLTALLAADIHPAIPRTGSGSAGEIVPLAHAFGVVVGVGQVLGPHGGAAGAATVPALPALAAVDLAPFVLGPKEGIALLAGVPGVTALAALLASDVRACLDQLLVVTAASTVAIGASRDPYLAATARGDAVQAEVLSQFRALVGTEAAPRSLQAPVSFRVVGPVLAHLTRAVSALEAAVDRSLESMTDSPAYVAGSFIGTAGFHGVDLAAHLDFVTAALVHAAEVSATRLHRLLDPRVTGLHAQLAEVPGPEAGLVAVHKRAAAVVHAMRRNAVPSYLGSIETSQGQEDVQCFAWQAAESLRSTVAAAREVMACELLGARRAASLAERALPAPLAAALAPTDSVVPPIFGDRPFGVDIEALRGALTAGLATARRGG
jgi:histidine ammonia-lyase